MLAIIALAAFIAAAAGTVAGFGSATILTPVLMAFVDIKTAIALVAIFHGVTNALKIWAFRSSVDWRLLAAFGLPAVALAGVGAALSTVLPAPWLMLGLGLFLTWDGISGLRRKTLPLPPGTAKNWPLALVGGGLSGLVAGIIGTGGAIRALFLHRFLVEKNAYVATSAAIALVVDLTRVPVYLGQKMLDPETMGPLLYVTLAAAGLGVLAAQRLLTRMNPETFRRVVLWALLIVGIYFIEKSVRTLLPH